MDSFMVNHSTVSEWYGLVREARETSLVNLTEDTENYLVFLLMRFMNDPEIVKSVLGTEYLTGLDSPSPLSQVLLQNVGDKCLLMAGLFPGRAKRKHVRISYFVHLGQNAYTILSHITPRKGAALLYNTLSQEFVSMMDVLQTTRELEKQQFSQLSPLEAYELWFDTKSSYALRTLQRYTR